MKIVDTRWFCGSTNVGIVQVRDKYDTTFKYYIAGVRGWNEQSDAEFIADYGSTFPKDAGDVLFGVK